MKNLNKKHLEYPVCRLTFAISLAVACGGVVSPNVLAQDLELERIIVTADKRGSQSIQDTAGSVQALSSEDLERAITDGFGDYARLVPSLQILDSGGGQTQIAMRGIFPARINHAQPQARSTAAVYLGETSVTSAGFNPDVGLVDVERIEILKGPQGTLYGASSMSGVIRILPKAAVLGDVEGEVGANIGTTEDGDASYTVTGVINLPISDSVALRASAYSITKGGYIDNVYTGEDDYNDEESFGGRIMGLWTATEDITIETMYVYHKLEADGRTDEYVKGEPLLASIASPAESPEQWAITDKLQTAKIGNDPFEDEFSIFSLTATLDYDWGTVTSVTSYQDREFVNHLDDTVRSRLLNGTDTSLGPLYDDFIMTNDTQNFAQELRVSSNSDAKVSWVVGLYYEDQDKTFVQDEFIPGLEELYDSFGIPGFTGISDVYGADENMLFQGDQNISTKQMALFGEAVFSLTEKLSLTTGLRWYDYEQETSLEFRGIAAGGVLNLEDQGIKEDGFNPKLSLSYAHSDDTMLYATAARGFRLGSLNEPVPIENIFFPGFSCAAEDPNNLDDGVTTLEDIGFEARTNLDPVKSDTVDTFELGSKMTLADGRVRLNTAAFYTEWSNIPTQAVMSCGYSLTVNASKVISQGLEVETVFMATENLEIGFNAAYTDSTLNENSEFLGAEAGAKTPFTPELNVNASFAYISPTSLLGANEWYVNGSVSYVSEQYSAFAENGPELKVELPSTIVANLFIGVSADSWEGSIYVKNLTNEDVLSGVDYDRRQPIHFTRSRPRTVGVDIKYLF
jgi:outer membrane receptor protein involved in Fe transport